MTLMYVGNYSYEYNDTRYAYRGFVPQQYYNEFIWNKNENDREKNKNSFFSMYFIRKHDGIRLFLPWKGPMENISSNDNDIPVNGVFDRFLKKEYILDFIKLGFDEGILLGKEAGYYKDVLDGDVTFEIALAKDGLELEKIRGYNVNHFNSYGSDFKLRFKIFVGK